MKSALLVLACAISAICWANNIQVSNVLLASQDITDNYYMVQFDLSWENSWRTSTYESNWDAAWVFIKFTPKNVQDWQHATLHYVDGTNDGHIAPAGCVIRTANNTYGTTTNGIGVFIYRDADGIGDISFEGIQLRWDYGTLGDNQPVEISVNAIEMVYIPEGSFYAGDGVGTFGQFEAGNSGDPFQITSEGQLTLGGTNVNNLSNHDANNQLVADDYDYSTTQTLPAGFPKGYQAVYCMKYEASQAQYAEFLTRLSPSQRSERTEVILVDLVNIYPILTGNHFAIADYPWRAMDYANWGDMAAYLDWAGLRPMSELEYEKICRGPSNAVENEYAWGNDSWYAEDYFTLANEGTANEMVIAGIATDVGNANSTSIYQGWGGPLRCGIFAASATNKTREETGATYYGVMEMSGNCFERVISTGNSQSRDFDGLHGDGNVTGTGNASFTLLQDWGFVSAVGVGFRNMVVSQRYLINDTDSNRERSYGIRGLRTAPN
ncbi:MAG: hypothetical protein R3301_19455 [Saprospiraceae bacterium]|nr:hypothetical protein [Saprospiraceae bacterium]